MLSEKMLLDMQMYLQKYMERPGIILSESIKYVLKDVSNSELENFIKDKRKPTFNQILFSFIDQKGVPDSDLYKRAGLDRRHFSKIRTNPTYRPGKNTALALAIALELNQEETGQLLAAAGYSLSESDPFDLVIQFCLEKKIYDLDTINQALAYFSLKPLAGVLE